MVYQLIMQVREKAFVYAPSWSELHVLEEEEKKPLCLIWQGKLSIQDETKQDCVPELDLEGRSSVWCPGVGSQALCCW